MGFDTAIVGSIVTAIVAYSIYLLQRHDRKVEIRNQQADPPSVTLPDLRNVPTSVLGATPETLTYRHEKRYNIFKGFLPHWHQGYGNYEEGEDFVWLEYECRLGRPAVVLIQVEGPSGATDAEWSGQKEALYQEVKKVPDLLGPELPWTHTQGAHATVKSVRSNKSTSVFAIDTELPIMESPIKTARSAIESVHEIIGPTLDSAWQAWWKSMGKDFISDHS